MAMTTNQQLILPDGTDNANVPLTFTDFVTTAGNGMENRLVQRYLSTADRTARNAAPNEGELSYLSDLDAYFTYNGSAWVPVVKGFVNDLTRTANSASVTTTETVIDFLTFTALAGARYKLTWNGNLRSSIVNDTGRAIFRWQTGGTLTTAGTLFYTTQWIASFAVANQAGNYNFVKTVTGIPAGTTSIGISIIRDTGSGNLSSLGNANWQTYMLLETV